MLALFIGIALIVFLRSAHSVPSILEAILNEVAVAMLIVATISAFFEASMSRQSRQISEEQTILANQIRSDISEAKSIITVASSGIEQVFRSEGEINRRLPLLFNNAHYRVDILRITSYLWDPDLQKSLLGALQRGVKVRVVQIDPDSPLLEYYADQERRDNIGLLSELNRAIDRWRDLAAQQGQLEFRLYSGLIVMSLMIVDETMFIAPYLGSKTAMGAPQIQLSGGPLFRVYQDYFDGCWSRAKLAAKGW